MPSRGFAYSRWQCSRWVRPRRKQTEDGKYYLTDDALQDTAATALRAIACIERGIVTSITSLRARLPPSWRAAAAGAGA
eukprot:4360958-Pyramimonas_sp.AAC.1